MGLVPAGAVCAGAGVLHGRLCSQAAKTTSRPILAVVIGCENGMRPFRHLKASAISITHLTVLADMINFQRIGHDCIRFCRYQILARFCKYRK